MGNVSNVRGRGWRWNRIFGIIQFGRFRFGFAFRFRQFILDDTILSNMIIFTPGVPNGRGRRCCWNCSFGWFEVGFGLRGFGFGFGFGFSSFLPDRIILPNRKKILAAT